MDRVAGSRVHEAGRRRLDAEYVTGQHESATVAIGHRQEIGHGPRIGVRFQSLDQGLHQKQGQWLRDYPAGHPVSVSGLRACRLREHVIQIRAQDASFNIEFDAPVVLSSGQRYAMRRSQRQSGDEREDG